MRIKLSEARPCYFDASNQQASFEVTLIFDEIPTDSSIEALKHITEWLDKATAAEE
jgi:hypothetical protein